MTALQRYIDHLGNLKGVQPSFSPILIEMLNMSTTNENGELQLYLNKSLKEDIAKRLNVSLVRVDHAVTEFVKAEYFKRIATGKYFVNQKLFGSFREISEKTNLIAEFNYNTNEINLVRKEEK